jgi:hypothetical protein
MSSKAQKYISPSTLGLRTTSNPNTKPKSKVFKIFFIFLIFFYIFLKIILTHCGAKIQVCVLQGEICLLN